MKITRRQLRKIINESLDGMYSNEVSKHVNTALNSSGLDREYRAMAGPDQGAFLASAKAEGPVHAEFEKSNARTIIKTIETSMPVSTINGFYDPQSKAIFFRKRPGG